MCHNAMTIATRLSDHSKVQSVKYPGLPTHLAHTLAKKHMRRFGNLIAVTFADEADAERFINTVDFVRPNDEFRRDSDRC
jgi:cystathionine gamma-lyase